MTFSKWKKSLVVKQILSHDGTEIQSMCDQFEGVIQEKLNLYVTLHFLEILLNLRTNNLSEIISEFIQ